MRTSRLALGLCLLLAGACTESVTAPTTSSQTTTTSIPVTSQTTIPVPTVTPVPTASQVYANVSPALGFIETPLSTGSGILIDDGLLVTNAHVVWPYQTVEVSFLAGGSGEGLPVIGVDWSADLALIDVSAIDTLPPPIGLDRGAFSSGDRIYLIGFPAEDPDTPEPAITSGIISRTRRWADADLTFIQTDALISGGQSGGALVDEQGAIIGITSLEIGDGFALALGAADVTERLDAIRSGEDPLGIGDRWIETLTATDREQPVAAHFLDELVWVLEATPGDEVRIEAKARAPLSGSVIGPDGFLETSLEDGSLTFTAQLAGLHFLAVVPDTGVDTSIELVSNVSLAPMFDPDHGRTVSVGSIEFANIDYPGDLDWFVLELREGDTILLTASSPNADMGLYIGPLSDLAGPEARSDSDSGAGVIGADAELRYTAATSGTYIVGAFDETQFGPGSYAIRIDPF